MKLHFFFIFFPLLLFSQSNYSTFDIIQNDESLNTKVKEQKIDSLLQFYKTSKQTILLVNSLSNYAKWQYVTARNTNKAIKISLECISLIEDLGLQRYESDDYIIYNRTLNNLSYFYNKKGDYYNAYKVSKKISAIRPVNKDIIKAFSLSAKYSTFLGDFYKAAEHYEEAIEFAYNNNDIEAVIRSSNDASICYKKIGTITSLNRGVTLLNNAIKLVDKTKDINYKYVFNLYEQLGNLHNEREDYNFEKSKKNYDKALNIAIKNNDLKLASTIYIDLSYLYIHTKNDLALNYIDLALKFKNNDKTKSLIHANKSLYFYKTNNQEKALKSIQKSIHFISPVSLENFDHNPSKEDLTISMYKYDLLARLISKSKIWLAYYETENQSESYLKNALETLKLADFLVDEIRLESKEQRSKLFWRKEASDIYTNAVKACLALNNTEDAFYFMEKNKAILLLEDLRQERFKEKIDFPQSLREKQLSLETRINSLEVLINKDAKLKDSVVTHLAKAKEAYYNFIDDLQNKYPILYKSQKTPLVLSLDEAKNIVNTNSIYIEYILSKEYAFGLLISNSKIVLFEINNHNVFLDNITSFKRLVSNPFNSPKDIIDFNNVSHALYNSLFPNHIKNLIEGKKLLIVADYTLQGLPFEALKNNDNNYLIEKNEISYAYSISFLEQNKKRIRTNDKQFIGFAPITFNAYNNLLESETEIENASKLFSSTVFKNTDATTANFMSNVKGHSITHIASHANANDSISPWIAFSDKNIYLEELHLIENSSNLVVLSACQTSLGEVKEGEGVMSLARGFFNTGANSVLSTQWNVNDRSSSKIISNFYKYLNEGETKSKALQKSKLNYLKTHQLSELSPYYWASFVLIGDSAALPSVSKNGNILFILGGILLLFLSCILYRKLKK